MKDYIALYLAYLQEEASYAMTTTISAKHTLNIFSKWLRQQKLSNKRLSFFSQKVMGDYYHFLDGYRKKDGNRLSLVTKTSYFNRVRQYFNWLCRCGYILVDPTFDLRFPKLPRHLPRNILTEQEIKSILNQPNCHTLVGLRDQSVLEVLYATGIRRSELIRLNIDDLNLSRGTLYICQGKGNKDRVVPIGERTAKILPVYLREVSKAWSVDKNIKALFLMPSGRRLNILTITEIIKKYMKMAGVNKAGSCHIFRHSMATHMLDNDCDIRYVQEILGHSRISTTQRYTHVSIAKLKQVYWQSHPAMKEFELLLPDKKEKVKPRNDYYKPNVAKITEHNLSKRKHQDIFTNTPTLKKKKTNKDANFVWYIQTYSEELIKKGGSLSTRRANVFRLQRLALWLKGRNCDRPQDVSNDLMNEYVRYLHNHRSPSTKNNLSPGTRRITLKIIKYFFDWLTRKGYILYNPTSHIRIQRQPKRLPVNVLTHQEVRKIIGQVNLTNHNGYRDRAILELLYASGVRREEMRCLLVSDLNMNDHTILIRDGKGKQDRCIPISHKAIAAIKDYLKLRPKPQTDNYLFLTGHGSIMAPDALCRLVGKYVKRAELGKRGSFLLFRHSVASQLLENGVDIRYIQQFLGHKDLSTTQLYTHVSINQLKKAHSRSHPSNIK